VKLLLTAALVLMLSSLALAATENQQLGPYMVSFDMNTPMQYQVQVQEPIETPYSTIYSMRIATDDTTGASIGITEYKNKTDATLDVAKQLTAMGMALRGLNVTRSRPDNRWPRGSYRRSRRGHERHKGQHIPGRLPADSVDYADRFVGTVNVA
jgi:hypothetical protein